MRPFPPVSHLAQQGLCDTTYREKLRVHWIKAPPHPSRSQADLKKTAISELRVSREEGCRERSMERLSRESA